MGVLMRLLCACAVVASGVWPMSGPCGPIAAAATHTRTLRAIEEELREKTLSRSLRDELQELARQPEKCGAAVELVNALFEESPDRADLAALRYEMLMMSRDYKKAERASEEITNAACGQPESMTCSEREKRIVDAYAQAWGLRARAKSLAGGGCEHRASRESLKARVTTLIERADTLQDEQDEVVKLGIPGIEARPLVLEARGVYLGILEDAEEYGKFIERSNEYSDLCPKYQDAQLCWKQWSVENAKLHLKGLSLAVGEGRDWSECTVDLDVWRTGDQAVRGELVEELVYARVLLGKTEKQVVAVLGSPDDSESGSQSVRYTYLFRPKDAALEELRSKRLPPGLAVDDQKDRASHLVVVIDKEEKRVKDAWLDWYVTELRSTAQDQ